MPAARLLVAPALLLAGPASAAEHGISLALSRDTIGVGPVAGLRLARFFGVHGDAALIGVGRHFQSIVGQPVLGATTDAIKLRTAAVLADFMPFGGGLRLSAGLRYEQVLAPRLQGPAATLARTAPVLSAGWAAHLGARLTAALDGGMTWSGPRFGPATVLRGSPLLQAHLGFAF